MMQILGGIILATLLAFSILCITVVVIRECIEGEDQDEE